jgi:hypothetical protein
VLNTKTLAIAKSLFVVAKLNFATYTQTHSANKVYHEAITKLTPSVILA